MDRFDESFYKELLDSISDGVYFVDGERRILYWNRAAERITGFASEEVIGKRCQDNLLNHIDDDGNELCLSDCPLSICMVNGRNEKADVYLHTKEGTRLPVHVAVSPIKDKEGKIVGAVEVFAENIEYLSMRERIKQLEEKAFLDALTGIPNRRYLLMELEKRIEEFKRYGNGFAVSFVDIDSFKGFNDNFGHEMGDKILTMVSGTLLSVTRGSDIIARYGGDEFVAVALKVDENALKRMCERMRILVKNSTLSTENKTLNATVSIGATIFTERDDLNSVIDRADRLMLRAKREGGDKVIIG